MKELLEFTFENLHKSPHYSNLFTRHSEGITTKFTSNPTTIDDSALKILKEYSTIDAEGELFRTIVEQLVQETMTRLLKSRKEDNKWIDGVEALTKHKHSTIVVSPEVMAYNIQEHPEFKFSPPKTNTMFFMDVEGELFGKKVRVNPYFRYNAICLVDEDYSFKATLSNKFDEEGRYKFDIYLTSKPDEIVHYNMDGIRSCFCGKCEQ